MTILVTGATGQVGGAVARRLLERDHAVRALVRDPASPRAQALAAGGATLVRGDLSDHASLVAAAEGAEVLFLVTTPAAGVDVEAQQGIAMVDAAKAAGVGHVVFSSVADAQNATGIPHFDSKQVIEEHLAASGLSYTAVAPAFFYDNVLFPWNQQALAAGRWAQALPADRPLKMISVADIAAFAVHVIEHPTAFANEHIDIAADELTGLQMAAALTSALGRPVAYEEQSLEAVRDQFEDMAIMYAWFDEVGFTVDVDALHARYPEIPWTPFADWARTQRWEAGRA